MYKKVISLPIIGLTLLGSSLVSAQEYKFDIEGQHAFVDFRIKHLGYSWLYGRFEDFDGSFTFNPDQPSDNKVDVVIKTESVNTNHAERDIHLRSADFLNVSEFPEAVFKSTDINSDNNSAKIEGDLTLNGVTRSIVIDAELIGMGPDPWDEEAIRAGFLGTTTLALKDFDIATDLGPASQEVELTFSIEGIAQ